MCVSVILCSFYCYRTWYYITSNYFLKTLSDNTELFYITRLHGVMVVTIACMRSRYPEFYPVDPIWVVTQRESTAFQIESTASQVR